MTDITHEAPERIWAWGWLADSVWQEQTWQHEDEPMSTVEYVRADLVQAAEQRGYANAMEAERKLHEDLIKAQAAEIERLRGALTTCEKYRDAYDEMGRIGTQAVRDLEAKLAKAVEDLKGWLEVSQHCTIEDGVCCCGDDMKTHGNPMNCGHSPLDHGAYTARRLAESTRATLAELKGDKP